MDTYFAVTAPGLEPFTSLELTDLGLLAVPVLEESSQAGVAFKGDLLALYRANLHLRTASRVLARVGTFFYATTYPELQKRTSRLPWERFLAPGQTILLRVTCRQSKLYNSEAVTRTIAAGLEERARQIFAVGESQAVHHGVQRTVQRAQVGLRSPKEPRT